jgi:hypothetical protein
VGGGEGLRLTDTFGTEEGREGVDEELLTVY